MLALQAHARKHASKQTRKRASERAYTQASKQASEGGTYTAHTMMLCSVQPAGIHIAVPERTIQQKHTGEHLSNICGEPRGRSCRARSCEGLLIKIYGWSPFLLGREGGGNGRMNLMMIPNWLMTTMVTMNTTMTGGKDMKRTRIWTMMMTVDRSTYM